MACIRGAAAVSGRRGGGAGARRNDAPRLVRAVRRVEVEDTVGGQRLREVEAQPVPRPPAGKVESHHLEPRRGVRRIPPRGLDPEDQKFRREGSLPRSEPRVHPANVGVELADRAGLEVREGRRRGPPKPHDPHQAIRVERRGPEHLREPSGADAAVHLHLPHPILRVHETEREQRIVLAPGQDVRHAVRVPDDLHRRGKPGNHAFAVDFGERPTQPDVGAGRHDGAEHQKRERAPGQPLQARLHDSCIFRVKDAS